MAGGGAEVVQQGEFVQDIPVIWPNGQETWHEALEVTGLDYPLIMDMSQLEKMKALIDCERRMITFKSPLLNKMSVKGTLQTASLYAPLLTVTSCDEEEPTKKNIKKNQNLQRLCRMKKEG